MNNPQRNIDPAGQALKARSAENVVAFVRPPEPPKLSGLDRFLVRIGNCFVREHDDPRTARLRSAAFTIDQTRLF